MNTDSKPKNTIQKKLILSFYFALFILLNIFDFLNFLFADLDFFKKLLSWSLIGYIFYKASFTKMFIGTRDKIIDLILIISFSMMTIPKLMIHYVNLESILNSDFIIFNSIINFFLLISNESSAEFEQSLFIIGLAIIILVAIHLLRKYIPTQDSLIGSFKIKRAIGKNIILILTLCFFSITVFNFFMEWFALAVDSLILILGLIYYLAKYIAHHTKKDTSNFLQTISNTGNSFYQTLISYFSNKKTFMIGVSIILALHLVVDIGVYLVPYTLGNGNPLYSQALNEPIINIFDFETSKIYEDFKTANSIILSAIILLAHLSAILFFFLIMAGPLYYLYKIIQEKQKIPILIRHLFLASSLLFLAVIFLPNLDAPLTIGIPDSSSGILGVEIKTHNLVTDNIIEPKTIFNLLIFLILFIVINIEVYYFIVHSKSQNLKHKILPIIVLTFFIIYTSIFYFSQISYFIQIQNIYNPIIFNEKYIRFIFLSAFYILGTIAFARYFIRQYLNKSFTP